MKRRIVWILLIAAAAFGVILLVATKNNFGKADEVKSGQYAEAGSTKTACDVFSLDIAQQILGSDAKLADIDENNKLSTENISVTNCAYKVGGDASTANVMIRAAKNKEAYQLNAFGFETARDQRTGTDQKVESSKLNGLGDEAYYKPATQQVSVLVNNGEYWVITQVGNNHMAAQNLAHSITSKL